MPHNPLLLTIPVTLFVVIALIEIRLTFGQGDLNFNQMGLPIHRGADAGVTLLVDSSFQLVQFTAIEQQLARANRLGDIVGRGGCRGVILVPISQASPFCSNT